jgi:hypothetical protein
MSGIGDDRLARLVKEIDLLLEKLEEAEMKLNLLRSNVHFCLDCFRVLDEGEWVTHQDKHTIIFTSMDHDGIWEWKRCLNWVKKKIKEEL